MADAENLLMETSEQNGNEEEEDQNGAELELMGGEEEEEEDDGQDGQEVQDVQEDQDGQDGTDGQEGQDGQDNGTDGGKIDASKGEEDAGWVYSSPETGRTLYERSPFGLKCHKTIVSVVF